MRRYAICVFLLLSWVRLQAQNIESFGIFGGFNVPITLDKGLERDARYEPVFQIRGTPVGFHYGFDRPGFGYVLSPSYLVVGQTYDIKNSTGGSVGTRDIRMSYFSLPVALKFHVNDLSFFRLSVVAAVDFCFLVDGQETLTHSASKLRFPAGVSVPTDPGYTVAYDGVFVPNVVKQVHVSKDKFNSLQLFGALGTRADLDITDEWSLMLDGRFNFALFDSRNKAYLNQLSTPSGAADINGNPGAPDLSGQRRDMFLSVTFGVSRIIKIKSEFKERHSKPLPKVNYSKSIGGKGKPKKKK